MLNGQDMAEIESVNTMASKGYDSDVNLVKFEDVADSCLVYITENKSKEIAKEHNAKRLDVLYRKSIAEYVDRKNPAVKEYYGTPDNLTRLKVDLYKYISGYGQITDIMSPSDQEDSKGKDIDEIRINELGNVWVEKRGRSYRLDDMVLTNTELENITNRLMRINHKNLAQGDPVQNVRTKEGYRVSLVDKSKSSGDSHVLVIRKFNSHPMTPEHLIQNRTMSLNIYRLLKLIVASSSSYVIVGATSSGKTITNGIMLRTVPNDKRILSIENPVELPLKKYDTSGRVLNDVIQYEAESKEDNPNTKFSVEDAITTALRQSPHWLVLGEARSSGEFASALTAGQTGHSFATTYHAEDPFDALKRYLTAYLKVSSEPASLAMFTICSSIRFIISQQKLPDGTRKIREISEIFPPKTLDSTMPIIKPLYKFRTDKIVEDPAFPGEHRILEMVGSHHRVGVLSKTNQERFIEQGVSRDRFEFLTKPVDNNEQEVYKLDNSIEM